MILAILVLCLYQSADANSKIVNVTFNKGSGQLNQANVIATATTKSEMDCGAQCLKKSGCKSFAVNGSTCVLFSDDSGVLQIPGGPFGYSCSSTASCVSGLVCRNSRCRCLESHYRNDDLIACKHLTELFITGINGDKNDTYFEMYWNPPTDGKFVESYLVRRDAAPDITVRQPHVTVSGLLPSTTYALSITPIVMELNETKYGQNHTMNWRTACSGVTVHSQHTLDGMQYNLRYSSTPETTNGARDCCAEVGAHLITIKSSQMLNELTVLLGTWGHGTDMLWIDARYVYSTNTFLTSDSAVLPWLEWYPSEPDGGNSDCLFIGYFSTESRYLTRDWACDSGPLRYVCEV